MNVSGYTDEERPLATIGGKIKADYWTLKNEVDNINRLYWGLFSVLGLTVDIDFIITEVKNGFRGIAGAYTEKCLSDIDNGLLSIDVFAHSSAIAKEKSEMKINALPPEKREKRRLLGLKARIALKYKAIVEKYNEENGLKIIPPKYDIAKLERCRSALYLTPTGIAIDVNKYIALYTDYMAGDESDTKKIHQAAADAINKFFNGAIEITQSELKKYFIISDGIIKINPQSIGKQSYARLGTRKYKLKKK